MQKEFYFKLKPELRPFIREARAYYEKCYLETPGSQWRKNMLNLKYFEAYEFALDGYPMQVIADYFKMSVKTTRPQIIRTQGKIEQYLKLKELGRL